ncbi:MAG: hypothetical protein ABI861_00610 [Panacibacter sp.]
MKKIIFTLLLSFPVLFLNAQSSYTRLITAKRDLSYSSVTNGVNGSFFMTYNMYVKSTDENILTVSFFDKNGNGKWSRHFKDSSDSYGWLAQTVQADASGFITADVLSPSFGKGKLNVFKSDTKGNILWNKIINVNDKMVDSYSDIKPTADGNVIITGNIRPVDYGTGDGDAFILKVNGTNGSVMWAKTIEIHKTNSTSHFASGICLAVTRDSGFIMGGISFNSFNASYDYDPIIAKYDKNGKLQWTKMISFVSGYPYSSEDNINGIV